MGLIGKECVFWRRLRKPTAYLRAVIIEPFAWLERWRTSMGARISILSMSRKPLAFEATVSARGGPRNGAARRPFIGCRSFPRMGPVRSACNVLERAAHLGYITLFTSLNAPEKAALGRVMSFQIALGNKSREMITLKRVS